MGRRFFSKRTLKRIHRGNRKPGRIGSNAAICVSRIGLKGQLEQRSASSIGRA